MKRAAAAVPLLALLAAAAAPPRAAAREVDAWEAPCDSEQCHKVSEWVGAFNLASFVSTHVEANESSSTFGAVMSSFGLPSVVLGSFAHPGEFQFPQRWDDRKLERQLRFPRSPLGDAASAMAVSLVSVVEFRDMDGDGVYHPEVDHEISHYALDDVSHRWQPGKLSVTDAGVNHTLHTLLVTTVDGVISVEFGMADADAVTHNGREYGSHSVRMDVTVEYRFRQDDTQLAISFAAMGTYAALVLESETQMSVGEYGSLHWPRRGYTSADDGAAAADAARPYTNASTSGPFHIPEATMQFSAANTILDSVRPSQIRNIYVSFEKRQPAYLQWGVVMTIGDVEQSSGQGALIAVVFAVLLLVIAIGAACACVAKRKHLRWFRRHHEAKSARSRRNTPRRATPHRRPLDPGSSSRAPGYQALEPA